MEAIADIIQCSICLEPFTDPRMLPCIHTFCLKCLQQTVLKMEEQQSKDKWPCPVCGMEFAVPPQGVEGFQKNIFMLRLKEIRTIAHASDKSCDLCLELMESDEDEVQPADVYCIQCHKNICKRCGKIHKSIADAKEHRLIPLGVEITEDAHKTISHQSCSRHKNEQVKMYCSDCKEVICVICFAENHQSHKSLGVEKLEHMFRQELKEITSEIAICFNEWSSKKQQWSDHKTNFQKNVKNIEQRVISRKNELIDLVNKCAQSLLEELASIQQARLKEIQSEMDENERQLVIMESFKAYCTQLEVKGTNIELCQLVPTLRLRAEELKKTGRTLCHQSIELIQLDMEQTIFQESSMSENVVGRIKVVVDSIRSIGTLDIQACSSVFGVTKLENKICVLSSEPNAIRIFHDDDGAAFDLQMEIELKQIEEPFMLESSEKAKCLYVTQYDNKCIWKITPDDGRVTEWLSGVDYGPGILSVRPTSEGHVLLITYDQNNQLKIYDSDSQLICNFPLPSNIRNPQHIIRKPNGEFIISHREGTLEGPWVISLLTSDGQTVLVRFSPNYKTQEFNQPYHLALDSDNNRLFVADNGNDRVIELDSDSLNFIKVLLGEKENGISLPYRIFYDGKKRQLLVVQWPNKVEVYQFTYRECYSLANAYKSHTMLPS